MALTADQQLALDLIEAQEIMTAEATISVLNSHPVVKESPEVPADWTILGTTI